MNLLFPSKNTRNLSGNWLVLRCSSFIRIEESLPTIPWSSCARRPIGMTRENCLSAKSSRGVLQRFTHDHLGPTAHHRGYTPNWPLRAPGWAASVSPVSCGRWALWAWAVARVCARQGKPSTKTLPPIWSIGTLRSLHPISSGWPTSRTFRRSQASLTFSWFWMPFPEASSVGRWTRACTPSGSRMFWIWPCGSDILKTGSIIPIRDRSIPLWPSVCAARRPVSVPPWDPSATAMTTLCARVSSQPSNANCWTDTAFARYTTQNDPFSNTSRGGTIRNAGILRWDTTRP